MRYKNYTSPETTIYCFIIQKLTLSSDGVFLLFDFPVFGAPPAISWEAEGKELGATTCVIVNGLVSDHGFTSENE